MPIWRIQVVLCIIELQSVCEAQKSILSASEYFFKALKSGQNPSLISFNKTHAGGVTQPWGLAAVNPLITTIIP